MTFPPSRPFALPPRTLPDGRHVPALTLAVHEVGRGPAVVLCHGFPELAYSWRHQFEALNGAGFRVVAPDQRGYGGSDRPEPVEAYDLHHLTGDLVALLDQLEIERAVFVGHDWGGFVAWAMPVLHPGRVSGVVGVNTPNLPRMPLPPTQLMRASVAGDDEKLYILWFQEPGVADPVLARDVRLVFERLMVGGIPPEQALARAAQLPGGPDMNPFRRLGELEPMGEPIISAAELDHYVDVFSRTGFTGGINWYRNMDRNWETAPGVGATRIEVPCLMVTAEWDLALRPELAAGMGAQIPDLETVLLEKCGHWTQQEQPREFNAVLVDWLKRKIDA
ncbi:MAG: alpha/beta hydrolase [Myxococcales bacterium]|nr:alpha/beta hydrolase [Myxococcales bacterium]